MKENNISHENPADSSQGSEWEQMAAEAKNEQANKELLDKYFSGTYKVGDKVETVDDVITELIDLRGGADSIKQGTWDKDKLAYIGDDGMPRDYAHLKNYVNNNHEALLTLIDERSRLMAEKNKENWQTINKMSEGDAETVRKMREMGIEPDEKYLGKDSGMTYEEYMEQFANPFKDPLEAQIAHDDKPYEGESREDYERRIRMTADYQRGLIKPRGESESREAFDQRTKFVADLRDAGIDLSKPAWGQMDGAQKKALRDAFPRYTKVNGVEKDLDGSPQAWQKRVEETLGISIWENSASKPIAEQNNGEKSDAEDNNKATNPEQPKVENADQSSNTTENGPDGPDDGPDGPNGGPEGPKGKPENGENLSDKDREIIEGLAGLSDEEIQQLLEAAAAQSAADAVAKRFPASFAAANNPYRNKHMEFHTVKNADGRLVRKRVWVDDAPVAATKTAETTAAKTTTAETATTETTEAPKTTEATKTETTETPKAAETTPTETTDTSGKKTTEVVKDIPSKKLKLNITMAPAEAVKKTAEDAAEELEEDEVDDDAIEGLYEHPGENLLGPDEKRGFINIGERVKGASDILKTIMAKKYELAQADATGMAARKILASLPKIRLSRKARDQYKVQQNLARQAAEKVRRLGDEITKLETSLQNQVSDFTRLERNQVLSLEKYYKKETAKEKGSRSLVRQQLSEKMREYKKLTALNGESGWSVEQRELKKEIDTLAIEVERENEAVETFNKLTQTIDDRAAERRPNDAKRAKEHYESLRKSYLDRRAEIMAKREKNKGEKLEGNTRLEDSELESAFHEVIEANRAHIIEVGTDHSKNPQQAEAWTKYVAKLHYDDVHRIANPVAKLLEAGSADARAAIGIGNPNNAKLVLRAVEEHFPDESVIIEELKARIEREAAPDAATGEENAS